jgi:hypothetical protein
MMIDTFATLLSEEQVERTHSASLQILEKTGLLVRNRRAREIFAENGAQVDHGTEVVKLPGSVVEHYQAMYPPTFTFMGRDPRYDCTVPDDSPLLLTGSSAPNIIDPVTGYERRATSATNCPVTMYSPSQPWPTMPLPGSSRSAATTHQSRTRSSRSGLTRHRPKPR